MKCAIHQPQFMPWLGYLDKIVRCDKFVFLDDVQFKKNEFQNRNRILVSGQAHWMTVPVGFRFGDTLARVAVVSDSKWRAKLLRTLDQNYRKAPGFASHFPGFADLLGRAWPNLAELNMATVRWLLEAFGIEADLCRSSEFEGLSTDPTRRLVDLCLRVGADAYLSGSGGRQYLDSRQFEDAGIALELQDFAHPVYPQVNGSGEFVSYLSALDALFQVGGGAEGRRAAGLESAAATANEAESSGERTR